MSDRVRLARDGALLLFVAALVLLGASHFFATWNGAAVSQRPFEPDAAFHLVLLVGSDGSYEERWLPAAAVPAAVAVDRSGIPAATPPPSPPMISKTRFTLHFYVATADGSTRFPTTSPGALGLAVLVATVGFALRNMYVGGAPWSWQAKPLVLPEPRSVPGRLVVDSTPKARPDKNAPPPRRRGRR